VKETPTVMIEYWAQGSFGKNHRTSNFGQPANVPLKYPFLIVSCHLQVSVSPNECHANQIKIEA